MPYKNPYNAGVAKQVRSLSQQHVAREKEINDFATDYEIPSQLESAVLHDPAVHGGSGFAAATVADLGFEPTVLLEQLLKKDCPSGEPRRRSSRSARAYRRRVCRPPVSLVVVFLWEGQRNLARKRVRVYRRLDYRPPAFLQLAMGQRSLVGKRARALRAEPSSVFRT